MTQQELWEQLELPEKVKTELMNYENKRDIAIPAAMTGRILQRTQWDTGTRELQEILGEDPDGMKMLWELLNIALHYSYGEYIRRGIPEDIFTATMKFVTRSLRDYEKTYHTYKFGFEWWFPREISLNEYRLGALEYELIEGAEREIGVHILSDADLQPESVLQSLQEFFAFRKKFYPEWESVELVCESWMMMPELEDLLGSDSKIVRFQKLFEIDFVDYDATWYMEWIFPGCAKVDVSLPERTTLQRHIKKYLLDGKKFGIAKGHLKISV